MNITRRTQKLMINRKELNIISSVNQQTSKKKGEGSRHLSVITQSVNDLNSLINRNRLVEWIKKHEPTD
jgi:hypothetical protein